MVLTQIANVLTVAMWAVLTLALAGLVLGFIASSLERRRPYHEHSAPIRAAIRWESSWRR